MALHRDLQMIFLYSKPIEIVRELMQVTLSISFIFTKSTKGRNIVGACTLVLTAQRLEDTECPEG